MNILGFYKLIENPDLLNANTLSELEQLIEIYPYVENFRILYALNLLILDDYRYHQSIIKAAFYSSDRKKLKFLVDSVQMEEKEDYSQLSQTFHEPDHTIEVEEIQKAKEIKAIQDTGSEGIKIKPFEEKKPIDEDHEREKVIERELQKKQIRTKAELLRLVKKRLAEIDSSKKNDRIKEIGDKNELEVSKANIIDRFIESQPSISRPDKEAFFDPQSEAISSTIDDDNFFVTETLARIHADQGNYQKASEIYQKLILKFPEKSSYFAAQIQNLNK